MKKKCVEKGIFSGILIVLIFLYVTSSFELQAIKKGNGGEIESPGVHQMQLLNGWEKSYGGTENDYCHSVMCTGDGGYIIAGYTYSNDIGNSDALLIKIDGNGEILWEKTYGRYTDDYTYSASNASDGGYIMTGKAYSYTYDSFVGWLIKVGENGDKQWEKFFGGKKDDCLVSIEQTSDGGYVLAGYTESSGSGDADIWLLRVNRNGEKQWENIWGGAKFDKANAIAQTSDGGYVTLFYYESFGFNIDDDWLYKLNAIGVKEWQRTYGGMKKDVLSTLKQTRDEGYIMVGSTESFGEGESDIWLLKTDGNGNMLWSGTFGGEENDYGYSVEHTNDGGYILAGSTESFGSGGSDAWVIKVDEDGILQWDALFGGEGNDYFSSIQQTNDGGYILAGSTESLGYGKSDAWVVKMFANRAPHTPSVSGSTSGFQWVKYTYNADAIDLDGDKIKFYFDWGDGAGNWTNFVASGESAYHSHIWDNAGTYQVKVKAQDENGGESEWSSPLQVVISPNTRPDKPDKPQGPTSGLSGREYEYTTSTYDEDGNTIRYGWDWDGNKIVDEWTSFYLSGESIEIRHAWDEEGNYEISVVGEDEHGARGEWSDPLAISMPKIANFGYLLEKLMKSPLLAFLKEVLISLFDFKLLIPFASLKPF